MSEPGPFSYLMLLALIAAVGAFLWANRPRKKEPQKPMEPLIVATPAPTPAPDAFLAEVEAARKEADARVSASAKKVKDDLEARFAGDVQLKARLSAFAKQQRLDAALIELWDHIKHFPAWMQRDDFSQYNTLKLLGLSGESQSIDFSRVEFDYEGQRFKIEGRRSTGYDSSSVDVIFFEDGDEVFALAASEGDPDEGERYSVFDIRAFRKAGNWAKVLLDLDARLRIHREKSIAEMGYFRADEIKERFAG